MLWMRRPLCLYYPLSIGSLIRTQGQGVSLIVLFNSVHYVVYYVVFIVATLLRKDSRPLLQTRYQLVVHDFRALPPLLLRTGLCQSSVISLFVSLALCNL